MKPTKIAKTSRDKEIADLVAATDHSTVVAWACDCAERVQPWFAKERPDDPRPAAALEAGRTWLRTGVFKMAVIRKASLDAHAAARDLPAGSPAHSAARAAGQAVAGAHVPAHSIAAALYAATAVRDAGGDVDAEREWQLRRLQELRQAP